MLNFLRMKWLFNRYVGWSVLWIAGLMLVAGVLNAIGIELAGNIQNWSAWLKSHASALLVWRLFVYGAVCYGWYRMRIRVLAREDDLESRQRFQRIEIGAVCALLLLEITNWTN